MQPERVGIMRFLTALQCTILKYNKVVYKYVQLVLVPCSLHSTAVCTGPPNLKSGGDGFPNTRVLVEYEHSLLINPYPGNDERMLNVQMHCYV